MDDSSLFDEVLQLTLGRHRGDANEEELARLERLLGTNRQAVVYYLKIVEDGLTVRELAEVRANRALEAERGNAGSASTDLEQPADPNTSRSILSFAPRGIRLAAAAITLFVTGALLAAWGLDANRPPLESPHVARIVNSSGVEWDAEAKQFFPWSHIAPGDVLKFRKGIVNLFIDSGVELLVEGPAELRFASLDRVEVVQGKLAARVGPDAIGFRIETPHANVIDRGTAFGISVDGSQKTDVVVYEGIVDLDVVGHGVRPRRRLATGEALRVSNEGDLSRIASVQDIDFLSPPQVRPGSAHPPLISRVTDNIRLNDTAKYNRIIPAGFVEDSRAYVDREHEWNGIDDAGLPDFLVGGDYVMTFNEDKTVVELELTVDLAQPANLYILIDNRVPPPEWLTRDFIDTNTDVGLDEVHVHVNVGTAPGAGKSLDQFYSVWKREVHEPGRIVLGPLGHEVYTKPARVVQRGMYGVVATPLEKSSI